MRGNKILVIGMAVVVLGFFSFALIFSDFSTVGNFLTGFAIFSDSSQSDFDNGTYVNTEFASGYVKLSSGQTKGNYTSKIFDATSNSTWNNISWTEKGPYLRELPNNQTQESFTSGSANMTGNVLLMHLDDASGDPVDDSGMSNTVSLVRGLTYSNPAKISTGLDFNGINGTIDLNYNDAAFNFSRSGAITVSAWIKPSKLHQAGDAEIVSQYMASGNDRSWTLQVRNNNTRFVACETGTSGSCVYATGTTSISLDTWYHVAGRWNGSNVDVYVNGVSENPQEDPLTGIYTSTNPSIRIARDASIIGNGYFQGIIDELAIWNRSLSDSEITDLYKRGIQELNLSTMTCDDSSCSGESWTQIFNDSPQDLNLPNNQYFRYKFDLATEDSTYSPEFNSIVIDYTVTNTAPLITLLSPQNITYTYNSSIPLNYTVIDSESNIDYCWYNIDSGPNTSLPSCLNSTFDTSNGTHNIIIYVNDTLGIQSSDTITFKVQIGPPTVELKYPTGGYTNNPNINFTYLPVDIDLDICELWGNFTGLYSKNQTDLAPVSGINNTFNLYLADGAYLWNINCTDDQASSGQGENKSFSIDTILPSSIISEPKDQKSTRTNIPIIFTASDNSSISCTYRVTYSTGSGVIPSTSLPDCNSSSFDLSTDGDYIFHLNVTDSAGNKNNSNTSFSVSTSSGGGGSGGSGGSAGGSGGSGGGGGGGSSVTSGGRFKISSINVIVLPGEEKSLQVSVKNNGLTSANKCHLEAKKGYEELIESKGIKNIGFGEIVDFRFIFKVIKEKLNGFELNVKCLDNISSKVPFEVKLLNPEVDISIKKISVEDDGKLILKYSLGSKPLSREKLSFRVLNSNGDIVAEASKEVSNQGEGEVDLDISKAKGGMLKIAILTRNGSTLLEENMVYDGSSLATGFVARTLGGNGSIIAIIILIFFVIALFVLRRIYKLHKGHISPNSIKTNKSKKKK